MTGSIPKLAKIVNSVLGATTGYNLVKKSSLERLILESSTVQKQDFPEFKEYIAKDRFIGDFKFDFIIANEVAKSWYDSSREQYLPEREWCISKIRPGMTIVDCGAHHGMMSVIFSLATGPTGRVIAYEALPSDADVIARNAALNKLLNVNVRSVGVGEHPGKFAFDNNDSNTVVISNDDIHSDNVIEIVRLDDEFPADFKVDFLKVDVEGHEVEALRGMRRVISQRPYINLEVHNFLFKDRAASLAQIATMLDGYEFTVLGEILNGSGMRSFGTTFPLEFVAEFENPHVFCTPVDTRH